MRKMPKKKRLVKICNPYKQVRLLKTEDGDVRKYKNQFTRKKKMY